MNRSTTLGVVLVAACGTVVWAFRAGTLRAPDLVSAVNVTVIVAPPDLEDANAAESSRVTIGYGSISGQVVFEGEIPVFRPLVGAGDRNLKRVNQPICAREEIPDESLVVDETTHGIANVFVYLPQATYGIHPTLKRSADPRVPTEIVGCRFVPHAVFARIDQAIVIHVEDPLIHNVHHLPAHDKKFGQAIDNRTPDERRDLRFDYRCSEPHPFPVVCDLHPWMKAHWLVLDHPYAAISDGQGRFTIAELPAGKYSLRVWHERAGDIQRELHATVLADETTDLGALRMPAEKFGVAARGGATP